MLQECSQHLALNPAGLLLGSPSLWHREKEPS
jgi:hypothetical protein